jgi:DNA-binding protein YbaB
VVSIAINRDVVDPDDVEMLQDLITAAVNDGVHRIKDAAAARMNQVTGGLKIPGLTG